LKFPVSRSTFLTAVVIAVLLIATPFTVVEFFKTGEIYILSHRLVDDMVARLHGPGRLRFLFQPIAAIVLGARDGAKDAGEGQPPFLWDVVVHSTHRTRLLRSALASVRDLIAIAILLDLIVQFVIFHMVHPGVALALGPVLIALPYATSRALTNLFSRWSGERRGAAEVK